MTAPTWREPEMQEALETLAAKGLSGPTIARRLRMTPGQVSGRAHRTGVVLQGKSGRPPNPDPYA